MPSNQAGARRVCALLVVILSTFAGAAAAQEKLFSYERRILADAPGASTSPATVAEYQIDFDVDALAASDVLEVAVELPDGRVYRVVPEALTNRGADSYLWQGRLVGPEDEGEGLITVYRGHVAGRFSVRGTTYELTPDAAGPGVARLLEIDERLFPEHVDDAVVLPAPNGPEPAATPPIAGDHGALIDVLVVFTPAARQGAGGPGQIRAVIQNAIDWTNYAYLVSGVIQSVALEGPRLVSYNEAGKTYSEQLAWVKNNSGVKNLRNQYGADMVALISEDGGGACGVAYLMSNGRVGQQFAPLAYSMTARSCAVGNLSFPHELGHNMGASHDPANAGLPADQSYPYSFGHLVDGQFRTVMSYNTQCPSGCERVAHFSNPNVLYNGLPTGIANQRHNARTLNNTASVVEAFRSHKRTFADVPRNHWAWRWIEGTYAVGVTSGCDVGPLRFCPADRVTRQQMAPFLLRAAYGGWYAPNPATGVFSDVPTSSPFAAWIEQIAALGVTSGCDASPPRFCPRQAVSRQQMAVFLLKMLLGGGYVPPAATGQFADVPPSSPFARWVEDLANRGITGGCAVSPARYCPRRSVSRASMAVFLSRTFDLATP